ncbi:MAG: DedA family protein [Candidatus Moranbacteria bacterium]|nr:DedA family protein [Candidatus Moranbacteria bacterium]
MELTGQNILHFMSTYGYWVILPLMIIEGPVATIIAAMLASVGVFNVFVVFVFSMLGDIIGDILFYWAGHTWGMSFVRKVGKYIGITENLILKMEKYFKRHGGKTIFMVKSTTGLCWATFTAAGIVGMNFYKFLKYSALGGVVWSGFLVSMGYFYGYMYKEISEYIKWSGWLIVTLTILSFVIINLYKKSKSEKIFEK